MIKHLLVSLAAVAMAFTASAETKVLWEAESPEGTAIEGWSDFLVLSAEETAGINAGDIITVTVTAKGTTGWPQVGLFEGGIGWPPMTSGGVGNLPSTISLAITYDMAEKIHANGATIKGESVYVSQIALKKGTIEIGPNTVWFGPQEGSWGNLIGAGKDAFANVKVGDKIVVEYDPSFAGMNINLKFNGWGGCSVNIGAFDQVDFITQDQENATITVDLTAATEKFNWADGDNAPQDWNIIALLRENGFSIQGPSIINQIMLIPANYYAVGGFQGWNVEQPAEFTFADGVYTLVAEKASTMKISTYAGNWDVFNSATIAPCGDKAEDGFMPYEVSANHEFVLDYEANWTVTINPANQTIKFFTADPKPVTEIYVRGGMNGWGTEDAWKFSTTDGNLYTLANVSIDASTQFKIADGTWGAINYGSEAPVAPNTDVVLTYNGGNIKLTESVENATLTFDLTTKTLNVSTGNAIEAISSDNQPAVYYNLQGVKVANPVEGNIYIVKKGAKVSKLAF